MKSILLASLAVACAVLAGSALGADSKGFPRISHEDLKAALASKSITLLDCNGSESYAQGHIPGAVNFETVKKDLAAKLPADHKALIVAYCGGEKCGAWRAAAEAADALGYTDIRCYSAGIKGWKSAGESVETVQNSPSAPPVCGVCGVCGGEK
jgi:rhodanese-related sulfurtransferase